MTDVTVRFQLDKSTFRKAMPEEDYEVIERIQDGERPRLYKLRPIMARFMVDENNQPMDYAAAVHLLGKLSLEEWDDVGKKFADGFVELAVPKANGNSSNSPSAPSMPPSEFPAGS